MLTIICAALIPAFLWIAAIGNRSVERVSKNRFMRLNPFGVEEFASYEDMRRIRWRENRSMKNAGLLQIIGGGGFVITAFVLYFYWFPLKML